MLEKTKKEKKEFSESCADWKECYTEQEACTKSALEQISVLEKRVKDLETSNQKFKKLAAASKTELADSKAEVSKVKIAEAKEVEKLNVSINKLVKSKTNEAAEFSRKEAAHQATIEAMKIEVS